MAKCPNCGAELKKQDDNVYVCEQCNVGFTLNKIEPSQQQSASNTSEETKIKELEARLATLEAEKQSKHKASEFFAKFAIAKDGKLALFFKKYWVILLVGVLLFVAFLTLMITLVGLRGIYVNVNDPNDFYDFDATSYRASSGDFLTGEETLEEGKWKLKGDKLVLTTNDEFFGKISDDFDFEKLDGFKRIKIDGVEYKRVSLVGLKTTQQKVKITFDPQNGDSSVVKKVNIGKKMQGEIADPQRFDGVFLGWFSEKGGNGKQFDPTDLVWENTTYYAHWYIEYDVSSDGVLYGFYGDGSRLGDDITLPSYVTSINFGAFAGNTNIREITIPDSVTSILSGAFEGCTGLQTVNIGNGVTNIASDAFRGCTNIETATLPAIAIDCIPKDNLNTVTITSGQIPRNAFDGCTGLQTVTIGSGVTSIGEEAFCGCTGLQTATIGEGVTSIDDRAFYGCTGLHTVNWNATNCTTRKDYHSIFESCTGLITVIIGQYVDSIPGYAFYNCTGLQTLTIESGSISDSAFHDCTGLKTVTIGENVTSIGEDAFYDCTGLQTVTIPDSVTSIDDAAFLGCTGLNTVTIGDGVESIGKGAFYDCTGLQTVTIGDSVTSIDDRAFYGCTGITKIVVSSLKCWCEIEFGVYDANPLYYADNAKLYVKENGAEKEVTGDINIPDGTTKIGYTAFYGLTGLTSVTIPDSVTSISAYAFSGCTCLKTFTVAEGNPAYQSKDGVLYKKEDKSIYLVPSAIEGAVTILDGCTSIGRYAFHDCTGLTEITIPNSVTSIGEGAFDGCTGMQTVTIGESVTSIDGYAFDGCTGITRVNYLGNLKGWCEIGFAAAYANPLYNGNTKSGTAKLYVKENGEEKEVAGDVNIPVGTTKIEYSAFYGLKGITSVNIPDSVTSIGSYAFYNCTGLKTFTVAEENSVYQSKDGVLYKKEDKSIYLVPSAIEGAVTILDGCTSIGYYAFSGRTGLGEITISDSVTSIGSNAFKNCTGLKTVTIPDSVTSIDSYAFEDCTGLKTVTIPESVTSIEYMAFYDCRGITRVNYLGDLKGWCEIGFGNYSANPLYYAGKAKLYVKENGEEKEVAGEVNIPVGITKIGNYAFYGFTGITSVTIPESVTSIGSDAFYKCTGLQTVNWNATNCTTAGNYDYPIFKGCTGLVTVNIGENVESIPAYAFYNCKNLKDIYYAGDETQWGQITKGYYWNQYWTGSNFQTINYQMHYNSTGLSAAAVSGGEATRYEGQESYAEVRMPEAWAESMDERRMQAAWRAAGLYIGATAA